MRFERERFSLEAGEKKGRQFPDWYLDQPPSDEATEFYIRAFFDLMTCRPVYQELRPGDKGAMVGRMVYGLIPWTAVREYSTSVCLDRALAEMFMRHIRRMEKALREAEGQSG